jgi:hypothetical protein
VWRATKSLPAVLLLLLLLLLPSPPPAGRRALVKSKYWEAPRGVSDPGKKSH